MSMKELTYAAKQQLESATLHPFRHAHVYELVAACFGFKSRTALHVNHVVAVLDSPAVIPTDNLLVLKSRLTDLGYGVTADAAGSALLQLLKERRLCLLSVDEVLASIDDLGLLGYEDWDDEDRYQDEEQVYWSRSHQSFDPDHIDLLIHELEEVAKREHLKAHNTLVRLYRNEDFRALTGEGSEYWHSQLQQGKELSGIELKWAEAYSKNIVNAQREAFHFQEAVRLGSVDARLELANGKAWEAETKGDFEGAKLSYMEAANLGDIDAMRALIYEYDEQNLFQNWVWVYLSELLSRDLRKSSLRAYHDGGLYAGEDYDDDQGGPMSIDGNEGVELTEMDSEQLLEAQKVAAQIYSRIAS
ncbi:hypothetical protein [Cycloclasticus pugetii]|uniref:hypothetical protein n=1 Tax=Cycloclasticus pugetii TaxID=34068 RepID=UPI003A950DE8